MEIFPVLKIEVQDCGEATLVYCSGRVVRGEEGDRLRRTVSSLKNALIVIDLSQVNEIDAGGLGALVALQRWAKDSQRTLRLLNPSRRLQEVLEMTHLAAVLDIVSEREYAVRRSA